MSDLNFEKRQEMHSLETLSSHRDLHHSVAKELKSIKTQMILTFAENSLNCPVRKKLKIIV